MKEYKQFARNISNPWPVAAALLLLNYFGLASSLGRVSGGETLWWLPLPVLQGFLISSYAYGFYLRRRRFHANRKAAQDYLHRADPEAPYIAYASGGDPGSPGFTARGFPIPTRTEQALRTLRTAEGEDTSVVVPDSVVPVVGYRMWRVVDGWLRAAAFTDYEWKPGINVASCRGNGHRVGESYCSCGFHANKRRDWVQILGSKDSGYVTGTIDMFGIVTEHVHGYRASHAVITGIFDTGKEARKVAKRYQVPLLPGFE